MRSEKRKGWKRQCWKNYKRSKKMACDALLNDLQAATHCTRSGYMGKKTDTNGFLERLKARLKQVFGIHFQLTFTAVMDT